MAIIALIATPIVLDVVDDARTSVGRTEATTIYKGINQYCATMQLKAMSPTGLEEGDIDCSGKTTFTEEEISKMVELGNAKVDKITYNNNEITELEVTSNGHKYTLCSNGTFAMDNEECSSGEEVAEPNLISTLLGQYQETNEIGLVKDSTNPNLYYYTGTNGEVSNNFLWYGGHQWRVLEFDTEANTITLITQQPLTAIQPASAGWEDEEAYKNSYINQWLNDYFYNSLDSNIQSNIQKTTFNIGIYTDVDEITTEQNVGLLDEEQYDRAGGQDSFLDIKDNFWLGNRYNSSSVRRVGSNGTIYSNSPSFAYGVRADSF